MKKLFLLPILFAILTLPAFAADKVGDPCPQTGCIASQIGDEVDGKWKLTSHVGTTQVTLSVQLMEGDKRLISATATTLDGQPVPIFMERTPLHGCKEGFFMMATPVLTQQDGKIVVDIVASKVEVNFNQDDMENQLPPVSTFALKQKLTFDSGKEILIPFGPLVESAEIRTKYTLKLVATKGL